MKNYIKLQYDNLDFEDDVPDDLVRRREVYAMLNHIGGAGAEEDYFKGWDKAIDEACDLLGDVDSVMPVTVGAETLARLFAHGKWNLHDGKTWCSVCGKSNKAYNPPYCPHCGAKMDGGIGMNHKEIMEKISELEQQIAELKEAAQKQDEPKAWKPDVGDSYFYFTSAIFAEESTFDIRRYDIEMVNSGNCFRTKERAEEVAKKIRMLLKLEQYHDMFCPEYVPDWSSDDTKYVVCYDEVEKQWFCDVIFIIRDAVQVYFDSEETTQKVCDLLNGEDEENES